MRRDRDAIKVSTITVTKNRCKFLKEAMAHYLNQTHENREMLIMYYADDEETSEWLNSLQKSWRDEHKIRIFKHIPQEGTYLGALRNRLIEKGTGEYIIIWDDDDYYAPERIQFQLNAIIEKDLVACTLRSLLLFSYNRQEVRLSFERPEGWEGSLMCLKEKMPLYMNMERYEDSPVLEKLFIHHDCESIHNPDLYVYHLHDSNISTSYHKEELFLNSLELNGAKNYQIKKLIGFLS